MGQNYRKSRMAKTKKQFNREYYLKYRDSILATRKLDRAINGQKQYRTDKKYNYGNRYNTRYYASRERYRQSEKCRAATVKRLQRWIDTHPEASEKTLEKMEYYIRVNERTVSLASVE